MNVVIVSNRQSEIDVLSEQLHAAYSGCMITAFTDPLLSAKYIWHNPVDIVFVEERMRPANGLALLQVIRKQRTEMPVVVLADDDYMREQAENLAADGYWLKPVTSEQIFWVRAILEQQEEKDVI